MNLGFNVGWFVGTFFFYWWHRIRHLSGFWQVFHQVHLAANRYPSRIKSGTGFRRIAL